MQPQICQILQEIRNTKNDNLHLNLKQKDSYNNIRGENYKFEKALLEELSSVLQLRENLLRMVCDCGFFFIVLLGFKTVFVSLHDLCLCNSLFRYIFDAILSHLLTYF